jgi:hypothetical protein
LPNTPELRSKILINRELSSGRLPTGTEVREVSLPFSNSLLVGILNKLSASYCTPRNHDPRRRVSPRSVRSRGRNQVISLNYSELPEHSRLSSRKHVAKSTLVPERSIEFSQINEVVGDFRMFFVRILPSVSKEKSINLRSVNLNLFTYRTNNWSIIV